MMKRLRTVFVVSASLAAVYLAGCKPEPSNQGENGKDVKVAAPISVQFNSDSAYQYVADQVAYGPRVPGTKAHSQTVGYLLRKLSGFCDSAYINSGDITMQSGKKALINNVVGVFNPASNKRIVLAAHFDTRPQADEDETNPTTPADGANDGGSGVGVLLEVARQLQILKPSIGIDIIFFDQEDAGDHKGHPETWCLGSQFWGSWVKDKGYVAQEGILLDMVGARNATFALEGYSIQYNQNLLLDVWKAGQKLGYGSFFLNINGGMITDDHVYMSSRANVPSIDIIHHDLATPNGFPSHWHKHSDNMEVIDRNTLLAVGHTVLHVVMNRKW